MTDSSRPPAPRAPQLENLRLWRKWLERHRDDRDPPDIWVDLVAALLVEVEALRAELARAKTTLILLGEKTHD